VNTAFKKVVKALVPQRFIAPLVSKRWWDYNQRVMAERGVLDIVRRFVARHGTTVLHGPFQGLRYPKECALTRYSTINLLGSYEMELHPWLYEVTPGKYERILDIGAAEGYYAVGMALRARTPVDAYETDRRSRNYCREMARLNGVSPLVSVHTWCSPRSLRKVENQRCLVFSDCEGYEVDLFTPDVVRALAKSDCIIEIHEGANGSFWFPTAATRELLEQRFAATHDIRIVTFCPRDASLFPEVSFLGQDAMKAISEEDRGPNQQWLFAGAKSN
jgi:hypothetical protein